jgi:Glyoxalase-like domain
MLPVDRRLPTGEEIFLDHVGHFVRDRHAAALALQRAGFAPTPISIQVNPDPGGGPARSTGTGNITAMFSHGYMEVLFKTADTPLAGELDAALLRYPGVHLAAFAVADAARWHRRLAANAFRVRPILDMHRPVDNDGTPGTAAFTLARLEPGEMPEGRIQLLTHRTEQMVWQRRWLTHPNGAFALRRVLIAVADVAEAAKRFARFTARPATTCPFGRTIVLDRGRVDLMHADGFAQLLPEIALPALPFMGAYEIRVRSLGALHAMLQEARLCTRLAENVLVARFPQELGHGAWLFTE